VGQHVVTYDDRNWELRWSQERRRINLSRAIGVDMESGGLLERDLDLGERRDRHVGRHQLVEDPVAAQVAASVTGERAEALKQRLRTGTVVTYDDRNWELRWSSSRIRSRRR
jgi:AMP nucleosidase